jgi:tRNA threonylcarbamoyladenosine biosynthesis protein TsaB
MTRVSTLAIATSGPHGGLALEPGGRAAHHVALAAGSGRGRDVLPALASLLAEAGASVRDVERIVIDVGPGSFTGVRVGVTLAKTLAWALDLRVWAVNSLDLLAAEATQEAPVLAVRDAGRDTVYHRLGRPGEDAPLGRGGRGPRRPRGGGQRPRRAFRLALRGA